jgi:dolichol-phosphate mannosyltransferase
MSSRPVLSVVGPVYNEEHSLAEFHARLSRELQALNLTYEIIYVNDGSADRTAEILRRLRAEDERVKVLHFSRNFGHQLAITAGIDHAAGQACVVMDTDGQDPPEIIGKLVAAWREGFEVVYAVRSRREKESLFKKATAALFYRLMRSITTVNIPLDAGDFRLMDHKVVEVMRQLRETNRFMRGLTSWAGFRQTKVEYVRKARLAGSTHYPLKKMVRFALDGITSFSPEPLRWVFYCGLFTFILSFAIGFWAAYVKYFTDTAVQGWTSLIMVILFLGGVQLLSVGVLGEYLGRVLEEVKRRPLYVVRDAEGFPAPVGSETYRITRS